MRIGVPKETKPDEYRISLLPVGVQLLIEDGHEVFIETQAGVGSGYQDSEFINAGAKIVESAQGIFDKCELVIKVKEPQTGIFIRFTNRVWLFSFCKFRNFNKNLFAKEYYSTCL